MCRRQDAGKTQGGTDRKGEGPALKRSQGRTGRRSEGPYLKSTPSEEGASCGWGEVWGARGMGGTNLDGGRRSGGKVLEVFLGGLVERHNGFRAAR